MNPCPDENEVQDLQEGNCSPQAEARLLSHVLSCPRCRPHRPTLDGRYLLDRRLGSGGMSEVFLALDLHDQRQAAVKVLASTLAAVPSVVARLEQEAAALRRIDHPNVVRVHRAGIADHGILSRRPFLVMEYVDGQSLRQLLPTLTPPEKLELLHQLAATLAAIHERGIIHRDLKPENVMVVADLQAPGRLRLKLLDFGLAKVIHESFSAIPDASLTGRNQLLGTPAYMSPEQCRNAADVNERTDVYSLGVVSYELLAGKRPFEHGSVAEYVASHLKASPLSLRRHDPSVPDALARLVHDMLAKDPHARPSMAAVAEALAHISGRSSPALARSAPRWRPPFWPRFAAALLCLGAAALFAWRSRPHPAPAPPGMVLLAKGTFLMGSSERDIAEGLDLCRKQRSKCDPKIFDRERSTPEVTLSSFYMDPTEVTAAGWAAWASQQPDLAVHGGRAVWRGEVLLANLADMLGGAVQVVDGRFMPRPGAARRPMTQVTWDGARAYCAAQGKRLPTEAQWEFAARGRFWHRYPWGDAIAPVAELCRKVIIARGVDDDKGALSCAGLGLPLGPADVATAEGDRSPQGVHDLAGNVLEWTEDHYQERYACPQAGCVEPVVLQGSEKEDLRAVRGGSWFDEPVHMRAAARSRLPRDQAPPNVGFRCVRPAGPGQ